MHMGASTKQGIMNTGVKHAFSNQLFVKNTTMQTFTMYKTYIKYKTLHTAPYQCN